MATATFSLGVVGTPNYIIVNAIKVSNPLVVVQSQVLGPAPTSQNIFFDNLDPVNYFFDWRISIDGIDQGTLVSRFLVNVALNQIIQEYRYYRGGGPGPNDPPVDAIFLTDPIFLTKQIVAIFKEGYRFLEPLVEWTLAGDTVSFLNDMGHFGENECITVILAQKGPLESTSSYNGSFAGVVTLTTNTTLGEDHYNFRINGAAVGTSLTFTLPDPASVPEKTMFYIISRGGNQKQIKIAGDMVWDAFYDMFGVDLTEVSIGRGEHVWIQENEGTWEIVDGSHGILEVGEKVIPGHYNHPNVLLADMKLYDGNIYPRLYWYIQNCLPSVFKFISSLVPSDDNTYYTASRAAGIRGQFGIDPTPGSKMFRMPDWQGISERGLFDFSLVSGDTEGRTQNVPGGFQPFMVGPHTHPYDPGDTPGQSDNANDRDVMLPAAPDPNRKTSGLNDGTNNIVDNCGVFYGYKI